MLKLIGTASGREYGFSTLAQGQLQYMDRAYQFDYVPDALRGCAHVRTCGGDKMMGENEWCFSLACDRPADVYVLYADRQPQLPQWLWDFERLRMNVTHLDTMCDCLKGYFSVYKKTFSPGEIRFYGNSPLCMLEEDWYRDTKAAGYCMYSVAVIDTKSHLKV